MLLAVLVILGISGCSQELLFTHSISLKDVDADGTPPRLEREFKYSFKDRNKELKTVEMAQKINAVLKKTLAQPHLWKAPQFTGHTYHGDGDVLDFTYFDVYFDTEDDLNYKNGISYRLRERFKSKEAFEKHIRDQNKKKHLPYRIEFQAKVGREELGEGFSSVYESRFEFREESEPFSKKNPPPPAPWNLKTFVRYFQAGKYKWYYTWPAKAVIDYLIAESDFVDLFISDPPIEDIIKLLYEK